MKQKNYLIVLLLLSNEAFGKTVIAALPKCGTHMLMKAITGLTAERDLGTGNNWLITSPTMISELPNHYFLVTHALCIYENIETFELMDAKVIFIYRDPRDQIVSLARSMKKRRQWKLGNLPLNRIITKLIVNYLPYSQGFGLHYLQKMGFKGGIKEFFSLYLPWKQYPFVYTTSFEKLVGPLGGGTKKEQLLELHNIANHIHAKLAEQEIEKIANTLFGGTDTFTDGQIGSWRKYFTEEHKNIFKAHAGQLLIDLGYEKDYEW